LQLEACAVSQTPTMRYARSQVKTTTTEVRTAVATLASIFLTPSFARIAVAAAQRADRKDQVSQVIA
jgi:hypothetical protein